MELSVKIGDNNDKNYSKEVTIKVDVETYMILVHGFEEDIDMSIYDKYYKKLINDVRNQVKDLPENWYIDDFDC